MSLKDLTADKHREAERHPFVKVLFSGKIDPFFYAIFLANQHPIYQTLEVAATHQGFLEGMPDLPRAGAIYSDLYEIWTEYAQKLEIVPVVSEYREYITDLSIRNPKLLMAHIYVRHMGDLYGGQMIKTRVPGSGKFYEFNDLDTLKETLRSRLDDSLASEAIICFNFAIKLFDQLMALNIPKYRDE